jgi:hypothetical protein
VRPWEYFNEIVGGTANGHRYFNDEGVDLGLRSKELIEYYDQNIKPTGEYPTSLILVHTRTEKARAGLPWEKTENETAKN